MLFTYVAAHMGTASRASGEHAALLFVVPDSISRPQPQNFTVIMSYRLLTSV